MTSGQSHPASTPALSVQELNVFYGQSHALQGVDLRLDHGVISVVGRNGMGKTTLCKTIMGLIPSSSGSVSFHGHSLSGMPPAEVARLGIGYVPQGRRLWRSLSVDEHLQMVASRNGQWTVDRIYATFPRLAERRSNGGAQLSGGEQQMLAISRALLLNPRLLVMDEPTEGLAPVIVNQVAELLVQLGQQGEIDVLVIEQNIGVATSVADQVAIMVNGRVNRLMSSSLLSADRELQQRLLGVGRRGHDETDDVDEDASPGMQGDSQRTAIARNGLTKIYLSNPSTVTRWSTPTPVHVIEKSARTITAPAAFRGAVTAEPVELRPLASSGQEVVLVVGTFDTKGTELRYICDVLREEGLHVRRVDLSTSGKNSSAEIPPHVVAAWHHRGTAAVLTGDRGTSVAGMTVAFERWIRRQSGIAGIISAGGSGGTALATPAMRALPIGVPKVMISTVASGNTQQYVGASDIMMLPSIADVQGLNSITRVVLGNGARALAGMAKARLKLGPKLRPEREKPRAPNQMSSANDKPAIGMTMFGVTTPCVQQMQAMLEDDYDCLIFHATGIGGRCMENLVESGLLSGVLDITTTEVPDLLMGGVFAATEDRLGVMSRVGMPYVGSVGAVDMVNFGAPPTVPDQYAERHFYEHNPQVTLMRTTVEENAAIGKWIGEKLNEMTSPVRFLLPEGGVSMLDAPGMAFHDDAARSALFNALEVTVRQSTSRQLIRTPHHINDPAFAQLAVSAFHTLHGGAVRRSMRRR